MLKENNLTSSSFSAWENHQHTFCMKTTSGVTVHCNETQASKPRAQTNLSQYLPMGVCSMLFSHHDWNELMGN